MRFFHSSLVSIQASISVDSTHTQVERVLVSLAVEKTLLQIGRPVFDKVENLFREKYRCTIMDAYDHPQYLTEILKEVFGKSHVEVINSIREFLTNFKYEYPIEAFIEKINK